MRDYTSLLLPLVSFLWAAPLASQQFDRLGGTKLPSGIDYTYALTAGDLNGDGAADLVWNDTNLGLVAYVNDGKGVFRGQLLPPQAGAARDLELADLDGDGDNDLVCAYGFLSNSQNRWLRNDGGGTLGATTLFSGPSEDTSAVEVFDVDGDGDLDVVFAFRLGPYVQIYLNDGMAGFTLATGRAPQFQEQAASMTHGDVDGDGDLDLVIGNAELVPTMRLLLNDGNGFFTDASSRIPYQIQDTLDVELGDVDGDGDLDLVCAHGLSTFTSGPPLQNRLFLNNGAGVFSDATVASLPVDTDDTHAIAMTDLDGDGDLDLWFANKGLSRLYLNDGSGRYSDATSRIPADISRDPLVVAADFDGDADTDVMLSSFPPHANRLYFNLLRHVHVAPALTIGQTSSIEIYAAPGFATELRTGVPLLAATTAAIPLGAMGTLCLDPATLVALPSVILPAPTGRASTPLYVPNIPGLRTVSLPFQAAIVDASGGLRLTNAHVDIIR